MHQHLHQYHPPFQLLKEHSNPIPLLHHVLVNPHQPNLHQGKGQYCHQSNHQARHLTPQETKHQVMIWMV